MAPFSTIPPPETPLSMKFSTLTALRAGFLALALMCSSAQGSTIAWGSVFQDTLYDSHGNTLTGTYSFEVGTFGAFVPTMHNIALWEANWKVFDRAYDPTPLDPNDGDPNGWNVIDQFFVGSETHDTSGFSDSPDADPTDVFAENEKVYLWAYNSKAITYTSEWALVTDSNFAANLSNNWLIPDPADAAGSFTWQLEDADEAVIGGVNNVQYGGEFSATPPTFSLQTAVVPEPGSAFLLFAAFAAHFIRRTRRLTRQAH